MKTVQKAFFVRIRENGWALVLQSRCCWMRRLRLSEAFLIALLLFASSPSGPVYAQEDPPVHAFSECKNVKEVSLLGELNHITRLVFEEETANFNLAKIVSNNWTELNIDWEVNGAVDAAIEDVQREEGYWSKLLSAWSSGRAEEFAERVSTNTFDSPQFQGAMERLSQAVVDDLTDEIQLVMYQSASSAASCVEEFVGTSFSQTMALSLDDQIQEWLPEIDSDLYQADIEEILKDRWRSGGVTILLGTQFTKLLAKRFAKGIVGKVVTRIIGKAAGSWIPIVGWVIGGGSIVWDLWEARRGSLPQIGEALKGEDVKEEIRTQIVETFGAQLKAALPKLSQEATIRIFTQWKDFLQEFEPVLRLAESNAHFRTLVDNSTADQVEKLTELVEIGDDVLGREWLVRMIESGEFEEILVLPRKSFVLLQETADPQIVLDWNELAGEGIIRVVETGLYRLAQPADFKDREGLEKVLDIEEPSTVSKLMQLNEEDRQPLLQLSTADIRWIFAVLSNEEINWLVSYLQELSPGTSGILVELWKKNRELISKLQGSKYLRSKFSHVLSLAATNQPFHEILNKTSTDQIEKLVELLVVANGVLTPEQLDSLIRSRQFEQILALPRAAFDILKVTKDPSLVLAWHDLAGETIVQIVDTGLYLYTSPTSFDGLEELQQWLALGNTEAIRKLPLLEREHQLALLGLETDQARSTLLALSTEELAWLAGLLHKLTPQQSGPLVDYVLQDTTLVSVLRTNEGLLESFPLVLNWAHDFPKFKSILERTRVEEVAKLTDLVTVATGALDSDQQLAFIMSGQFETILGLPEPVFEILRERRDPELAIEWSILSGELITQVVKTKLHLHSLPDDYGDTAGLGKVLALKDSVAIRTLMDLEKEQRDALLHLTTEKARAFLLSDLSHEDRAWLTERFLELLPAEFALLIDYTLRDQSLVHKLRIEIVGDALLESKKKESALNLVLLEPRGSSSLWPTTRMVAAAMPLLAGDLPWPLYWHYYSTPSLILLSLVVALIAVVVFSVWFHRQRKTALRAIDLRDSRRE